MVADSSVARDIYDKLIRKGEDDPQKKLIFYSRTVVFLLVVVALIFGYVAEELVFWLVLFAWAELASIGRTSLLAQYWEGSTRAGVMAGMIAGAVVTIIWYYIPALSVLMYKLIPGFISGLLVTRVVSLLPPTAPDTKRAFEDMFRDF